MSDPEGLHVVDHEVPGVPRADAGPGVPGGPAPQGPHPLVVLVHGSLDRGASFSRVVRRLPGCHVVTYDRRGYQQSRGARPLATSLADHVADLLAIVETRRHAGHPVVVVGHSYGALVALGAAAARTGAIAAVGSFEPPLPWLDFWPSRRGPRPDPLPDPAEVAEWFFRRMVGDQAWERLGERAKEDRRADGPALAAEMWAGRRAGPPFEVTAIEVPVLLGYGDRTAPHHREAVRWLADEIDDAEVFVIPGAGHGAHLSHPGLFAGFVGRTVDLAGERARASA